MAKAKRVKTRYENVYRVGERFEWKGRRPGVRGMADTAIEARDAKAKADQRQPVAAAVARVTFGAHAREWIDAYQGRTGRGFSESSRIGYRSQLERWAIPFFDQVRPRRFAEVTKPDMKAFIGWLANPQRKGLPDDRAGEVLTPATIQRIIAPVKAMYEDAGDDGLITHANPAKVRINVRAAEVDPDDDDGDAIPFTLAQLLAVKMATPERDRLLIDTLAETALRWGEVAEARGRDLSIDQAGRPILQVRRAYSVKTKTITTTKSGNGRRDIPLTPELARRLWRLQRGRGELLFTAPRGERMSYANTRRRVLAPVLRAASEAIGEDITWAGFHTFRHTCASLMFARGRDIKQVCLRLGHHKASYTLDTYIHLMGDNDGGPVDVDAVLVADQGAGGTQGAPRQPETTRNDRDLDAAQTAL